MKYLIQNPIRNEAHPIATNIMNFCNNRIEVLSIGLYFIYRLVVLLSVEPALLHWSFRLYPCASVEFEEKEICEY